MRPILSLAVLSSLLLANEANLDIIKPIREFAPPPVITPNVAQSAFVENQFDRTQRSEYPFVTICLITQLICFISQLECMAKVFTIHRFLNIVAQIFTPF